MSNAENCDRLESRICDDHLVHALGCRVALIARADICLENFKYVRKSVDQFIYLLCSLFGSVIDQIESLAE